jgi:hypothetical protein
LNENIEEFRRKFLRLADSDSGRESKDRVVALNVQMFPVTGIDQGKKGSGLLNKGKVMLGKTV